MKNIFNKIPFFSKYQKYVCNTKQVIDIKTGKPLDEVLGSSGGSGNNGGGGSTFTKEYTPIYIKTITGETIPLTYSFFTNFMQYYTEDYGSEEVKKECYDYLYNRLGDVYDYIASIVPSTLLSSKEEAITAADESMLSLGDMIYFIIYMLKQFKPDTTYIVPTAIKQGVPFGKVSIELSYKTYIDAFLNMLGASNEETLSKQTFDDFFEFEMATAMTALNIEDGLLHYTTTLLGLETINVKRQIDVFPLVSTQDDTTIRLKDVRFGIQASIVRHARLSYIGAVLTTGDIVNDSVNIDIINSTLHFTKSDNS